MLHFVETIGRIARKSDENKITMTIEQENISSVQDDQTQSYYDPNPADDWEREFLQWALSHAPSQNPLPDEYLTRDHLYPETI
jgi:hypothetical protein